MHTTYLLTNDILTHVITINLPDKRPSLEEHSDFELKIHKSM